MGVILMLYGGKTNYLTYSSKKNCLWEKLSPLLSMQIRASIKVKNRINKYIEERNKVNENNYKFKEIKIKSFGLKKSKKIRMSKIK